MGAVSRRAICWTKHPAGSRARVACVAVPGLDAIDIDCVDTNGRGGGGLEGGGFGDGIGVKHDKIGIGARLDDTPVLDSETLGSQASHLPDGRLQGKQAQITAVVPQNAWKGTPQAGMRMGVLWQSV